MRSPNLTTRPPVKTILKAPVKPYLNSLKLGIIGVFMAVIVDEATRSLINLGKFLRIVEKME